MTICHGHSSFFKLCAFAPSSWHHPSSRSPIRCFDRITNLTNPFVHSTSSINCKQCPPSSLGCPPFVPSSFFFVFLSFVVYAFALTFIAFILLFFTPHLVLFYDVIERLCTYCICSFIYFIFQDLFVFKCSSRYHYYSTPLSLPVDSCFQFLSLTFLS